MKVRVVLVGAVVASAILAATPLLSRVRTLSLDERVEAQRAIEEVYWRHRTWPSDNPGPKPPLSAVMGEATLRARVEDTLKKSNALAQVWGRPVTSAQLQAEMERMARQTRAPELLRELFAALDNDPALIAETLVRQKLVDRFLRDAFAYDERFHGEVRRQAEEALARTKSCGTLRSLSGEYRETTWRRDDFEKVSADAEELRDDGSSIVHLDAREWEEHQRELASKFAAQPLALPINRVSALDERPDAFVVTSIVAAGPDEVTTASVVWRKRSFDSWWAVERDGYTAGLPEVGNHELVQPRESSCTDDTWQETLGSGVPEGSENHTAVWTGTEMIVWGGRYFGAYPNAGARYDPLTDTWSSISTGAGVPSGRYGHTAVWTGTEMIVWGGYSGSYLNTGGRYNPLTDTWSSISTGTGSPSGRSEHTAVWTGATMIVWGGIGATYANTGGRYDPSTDTWTPTSTGPGAPIRRYAHAAVWTGSKMIVWGGAGHNTGGRYDPSSDTWAPTATGGGEPSSSYYPTAVWTGTEMIVFSGRPFDDGSLAHYDPSTDTWTAIPYGPSYQSRHTAVWTGTKMIIWGGSFESNDGSTTYLNVGFQYDPSTHTFSGIGLLGAGNPSPRDGHTAVWTGTEMIVWGGNNYGYTLNTGGRYDPSEDKWSSKRMGGNVPSGRYLHTAVWTGTEMIVWGGDDYSLGDTLVNTGARYDPATDAWSPTSTGTSVPAARSGHSTVWTGTEMIVWGGWGGSSYLAIGGRYDPTLDTWSLTPISGAPTGRSWSTAVWTGTEMIVWGGSSFGTARSTGGRYDPSTDTWSSTSTGAGVPSGRTGHTAVWTGKQMIVWGGSFSVYLNTGGRYDPSTDSWSSTSTSGGVPSARDLHTAVWTGTQMIVWGGQINSSPPALNTGGRYDPATDTWLATSTGAGVAPPRRVHTAVWTGAEMIVWGGEGPSAVMNTGGRYSPSTDTWSPTSMGAGVPSARDYHTAVWTGTQMIVWGGYLRKASGGVYCAAPGCLAEPSGCDDSNTCTTDSCDTSTRQCVNTYDGTGEVCDLDDGEIWTWRDGKTTIRWQAEHGPDAWNVYVGSLNVLQTTGAYTQAPGSNPLAARACGLTETSAGDIGMPPAGEASFSLVTGVAGGVEGSLGSGTVGPRANANPCP